MKDGHPDDAIAVLAAIGPVAKAALPALLVMLKSRTPYFRENAAEALGAIGPDAKEALPAQKETAEKDPRPNVREAAAAAVAKIEMK